MQIKQLNVSYLTEQDRILIRVNTSDSQEFLLWLTRRMTIQFWPAFQKSILELDNARVGTASASASARKAYSEFEREKSLRDVKLGTAYDAANVKHPLGAEPLLVTSIDLTPSGNSQQLHIRWTERLPDAPASRSFELNLQPNMYHGLAHLFENGLQASLWREQEMGLALSKAEAPATSAEQRRYLN